MQNKETETFCPASRQHWRVWLKANHDIKQSVWLIYYKKKSNVPTITYNDAVDEALCFGWIDSRAKPLDEQKFMQFFSRRKNKSVWSKINKAKVQRLAEEGLITKAGYESIDIAKKNGSWVILDDVEEYIISSDLELEFGTRPGARDYFLGLSKSVRKSILLWIVLAKRPETRQRRITEVATLAGQKMKPKQF